MKKTLFLIATLGVLLVSCGGEKAQEKDTTPAISVNVSKVNAGTDGNFLTASGKIEAVQNATLSTRTMGYVKKVYVEVGSKVRKGQLLLSINNADLTAQKAQTNAGIAEAKAAFENAKKDYLRFKNLYESKSASQKEFDDMTAHYNMAKARLEAAQQMGKGVDAQFSYSNIRAPFSGIITQKFTNAGDMANPGMPLLQIENPNAFQVVAMVPENEVAKIKKNSQVEVLVKSLNQTISGKVQTVSSSAASTGGQYLVKIALPKGQKSILAGMYTTVKFPTEGKTATTLVTIPKSAIVRQGELTGVYTISQSGTAILRWVRLGNDFGDNVEVLSGLNPEESYIVSAAGKLYNGAKVSVK